MTNGKLEELIAWTQEVSGATISLAVSSRVKAPRQSQHIGHVMTGTRSVNHATAAVVLQVRKCLEITRQREAQNSRDFEASLEGKGFYEINRMEMDCKIACMKLETERDKEYTRLRALRKKHAQLKGGEEGKRIMQQEQKELSRARPNSGLVATSPSAYAQQVLSARPENATTFFGTDTIVH